MTEAKLYVILGSHACRTGMLLLEHKGIPYETVTLPTGFHPMLLPLLGFGGNKSSPRSLGGKRTAQLKLIDRLGTVPALRMGEERVDTNHDIARFLDKLQPDPPLFPADPARRAEVEQAERFGDEVLQMVSRRLALAGRSKLEENGRLGPLLFTNPAVRRAGAAMFSPVFGVNTRTERELLGQVPGILDRIDAWVDAGVLNGEHLGAADFMIAPSLALLCYRPDVRPEIERRPSSRLLDRVLPGV